MCLFVRRHSLDPGEQAVEIEIRDCTFDGARGMHQGQHLIADLSRGSRQGMRHLQASNAVLGVLRVERQDVDGDLFQRELVNLNAQLGGQVEE